MVSLKKAKATVATRLLLIEKKKKMREMVSILKVNRI